MEATARPEQAVDDREGAMGVRLDASRAVAGAPAARQPRIPALEGLRAYAITLVFLVHFLSQYFNGATVERRIDFDGLRISEVGIGYDLLAYYFWASHYGVDLFFFLSGFLIFRLVSRGNFNYFVFLRNRVLRLYPALVVALAIYIPYAGHFWHRWFDLKTIAQNVLLLHGIWELQITPIIVPTWSLTFEWLFYLSFPILLLMARRRPISVWYLVGAGAIVLGLIAPIGDHYIRFAMFIAGAVLACSGSRTASVVTRIPDTFVASLFVLANLIFVASQNYRLFIPVFLVTTFLLVAKVVYGDGFLHRAFRSAGLRRLGEISYSFYLYHGLVIVITCDHLSTVVKGAAEPLRFGILFVVSFGASILVATASYAALERPYFRRKSEPAISLPSGMIGAATGEIESRLRRSST